MKLAYAFCLLVLGVAACGTPALPMPASAPAPFSFRAPAGDTQLGRMTFFIADPSRAYEDAPRQVGVRVFYPTDASHGARAPYAPSELIAAMQDADYFNITDENLGRWRELRLASFVDAPPSHRSRWPLVVFGPGYGVSSVNYTVFAQDIASRGAVVAVIDSPGLGFMLGPTGVAWAAGEPDESLASDQTLDLAADARMVIDAILAREEWNIDPQRISMMGHSLGGAAALEACRLDTRLRACINLDGHPFGPIQQHGMRGRALVILNQPAPRGTPLGPPGVERAALWRGIAEAHAVCAYFVTISETSHLSFADFYAVLPQTAVEQLGALPGDDLYAAVDAISTAFLYEAFAGALDVGVARETAARDYARLDAFGQCGQSDSSSNNEPRER